MTELKQQFPYTDIQDVYSAEPIVIQHEHEKIHAGNNYYFTDKLSLGLASQDYLITTPNTSVMTHFVFFVDFLFVTQLDIFEASDKTGTSVQTVFNSNRLSANTTATTLYKGTSGGTTDGTNIYTYQSGLSAGTGATHVSSGGTTQSRNEIDLKKNTKYIFRVTSTTLSNLINVYLSWYED